MRGEGTTFNHWVCEERGGPTPIHPEPGRETSQRRSYWRLSAGNLGPRTRPMMTPGNQIRLPGVVCLVHALFTGRSQAAMPSGLPVVHRFRGVAGVGVLVSRICAQAQRRLNAE